jgi:hypothetical protein
MQPYFLPYIGYFQLIAAVDQFVVYDNIKYTKKGWINRNRLLQNGRDVLFSLPLKHDSDSLEVRERQLAPDFDRDKLLNQFKGAYRRAPHFDRTFSLIEGIVRYEDTNLFQFLHNSIVTVCEHLGIKTEIRISSSIPADHGLKGQERVLSLCAALGAETYVNAIGGLELYSRDAFAERGIQLTFIRSKPFAYAQFDDEFVPWLSIVDALMFTSVEDLAKVIDNGYELS